MPDDPTTTNETPQPVIPLDDQHREDLDEAAHEASQ